MVSHDYKVVRTDFVRQYHAKTERADLDHKDRVHLLPLLEPHPLGAACAAVGPEGGRAPDGLLVRLGAEKRKAEPL